MAVWDDLGNNPLQAMILGQALQNFAGGLSKKNNAPSNAYVPQGYGRGGGQGGGGFDIGDMLRMQQLQAQQANMTEDNQLKRQQFEAKQTAEQQKQQQDAIRQAGIKQWAEKNGMSYEQALALGDKMPEALAKWFAPHELQAVDGTVFDPWKGTAEKNAALTAGMMNKAIAGRPQTNVTVNNAAQNEFDKKVMGAAADDYLSVQKDAEAARAMATDFSTINDLLANSPDTGRGWEQVRLKFAKHFNSLTGMNIGAEDIATKEAANSLVNQFALKARSPGGPLGGLPGAASDPDREFLVSIPPGIENTPMGRQLMTDVQNAKAKHAEARAAAVREFVRGQQGSVDPYSIQAFKQSYDANHNIFDDEFKRKYDFSKNAQTTKSAPPKPQAATAPAQITVGGKPITSNSSQYFNLPPGP